MSSETTKIIQASTFLPKASTGNLTARPRHVSSPGLPWNRPSLLLSKYLLGLIPGLLFGGNSLAASLDSVRALDSLELMVVSTVFEPGCSEQTALASTARGSTNLSIIDVELPAPRLLTANCATDSCFSPGRSTEDLDISSMFCDIDRRTRDGNVGYAAPSGCVRWWPDLSLFDCSAPDSYSDGSPSISISRHCCRRSGHPHEDEWTSGHEFGQDDREKPVLVEECLSGCPCVYFPSMDEMFQEAKQPAALELQSYDPIALGVDLSVFLLVKTTEKAESNYCFLGSARFCIGVEAETKALVFEARGKGTRVSWGNAVRAGDWQLIEIYRDERGSVQAYVDAVDVTVRTARPVLGPFRMHFFGSSYANRSGVASQAYVAAALIFSRVVSEDERRQVRSYLQGVYGWLDSDPANQIEDSPQQ